MPSRLTKLLAAGMIGIAAPALTSVSALAHHGWSWTQSGFFQLEGVISEVFVGNPHAMLKVDVEGTIWHVDLAPPSRTVRAGFTEDVAALGEEVTVIGNRSQDEGENRMKAIRVIVGSETYNVYPRRAAEI